MTPRTTEPTGPAVGDLTRQPPAPVAPAPSGRDSQRARVYAAEASWEARLDAARRGARRAEVAGSAVLLPEERLFGTLDAAQAYADVVTTRRALPPVRLRARRGQSKAHWESPDGIALPLPTHGSPWALREAVLLHELAHHESWHTSGDAGHGPAFTARMLDLVEEALGAEAAFALRVDLAEHGAQVGR